MLPCLQVVALLVPAAFLFVLTPAVGSPVDVALFDKGVLNLFPQRFLESLVLHFSAAFLPGHFLLYVVGIAVSAVADAAAAAVIAAVAAAAAVSAAAVAAAAAAAAAAAVAAAAASAFAAAAAGVSADAVAHEGLAVALMCA